MARNRGCVALEEKRACRWDFESLLQAVCKAQALSHKWGTLGARATLCPHVMEAHSPGTPFGWFYPRLISFLAWRNVPPLALLNVGRCESLWCNLALLFFAGERSSELHEDNSSSVGVSMLSEIMGSFPLLQAVGCFS